MNGFKIFYKKRTISLNATISIPQGSCNMRRGIISVFLCSTALLLITWHQSSVRSLTSSIKHAITTESELAAHFLNASWQGPIQSMCHTQTRSKFAVVSMLSTHGDGLHEYIIGLCKIGTAVRLQSNLDMVLMTVGTVDIHDRTTVTRCGWTLCPVPVIEGPLHADNNRYLQSKMYSKLNLWRLQYECVLYVDADVLLLRPFRALFDNIYPIMLTENKTIAMSFNSIDPRITLHSNRFNAGVLLVIPDVIEYENMVRNISITPHDSTWAEQTFLNAYYKDQVFELPYIYNAFVSDDKGKFPHEWNSIERSVVILHYVTKPWSWTGCLSSRVEEWCLLWYEM